MTYLDIVAYDKTVGGMNSLLNYNFHLTLKVIWNGNFYMYMDEGYA